MPNLPYYQLASFFTGRNVLLVLVKLLQFLETNVFLHLNSNYY